MRIMSAKEAKDGFGRSIDSARAVPATSEKHGQSVMVVLAAEEYLKAIASEKAAA